MTLPQQRSGEDITDETKAAVWATVQRAQQGDKDAIADLYTRYHELLRKFAYFRCGSHVLADDIVQDVWVRALRSLHSYTFTGTDFGAWLTTICRNLITDHFKSSRTRLDMSTPDILVVAPDLAETRRDFNPESALDAITSAKLHDLIGQLTPEQADTILLRYIGQYSVAETAALTGKDAAAVKSSAWRALQKLRVLAEEQAVLR